MNGTFSNLTTDQKLILKQFREDVQDVLKTEHDDYFLLRWLKARQFDSSKAEAMLRKSLLWRKRFAVDSLLTTYKAPEVILKYSPNAFLGFDKNGSSIRYLPQGNVDFKGMVQAVNRQDMIKTLVLTYEEDIHRMKLNNKKTGKYSDTFVYIMDYSGFSVRQVASKAVMDIVFELIRVFESNYPERLKTAFAINVPPLFSTLFALVKPLLAEETRKKFQFYGKDGWQEALLENIDSEVLPVTLGGTRVDKNGDPACSAFISPGGLIPESYYIRNRLEPRLLDSSDNFKALIEARSDFPVEIHVPHEQSLIEWELESDGELGIGLLFLNKVILQEQNKELYPVEQIVPVERLSFHLGTEVGTFYCEKSGFYVMQFDNSFSKFKHKNVVYRFNIVPTKDVNNDDERKV